MRDPIVSAERLGKRYSLGVTGQRHDTLRDALMGAVQAPGRWLSRRGPSAPREPKTIWALKDVSFEVQRGEVLGIIGRNGAGKSTLLKVLSRISEPTEGRAVIRGRVGSLLEVGTGFHPELTGRDNIFLNGSILGMSRAEIRSKFDEIVAFAGVEQFLETPVKRFSSGMYVRLAFAVAAHLDPEVLVIDEVLAVGDAEFQRKCLSKMEEVGQGGRTILFVSHNMPAVTRLCPRTILLDGGRILKDGPSHEVIHAYLRSGLGTTAAREWPNVPSAPGDAVVRLCGVRVRTEDGRISAAVDIRRPVGIETEFVVLEGGHRLVPNLHLFNEDGICVFVASEVDSSWHRRARPAGRYKATAWIPGNLLAEGTLIVHAAISTLSPVVVHCYERDAVAFQVIDSRNGDSARGDYGGPIPGVVRPLLRWETADLPTEAACSSPRPEAAQ